MRSIPLKRRVIRHATIFNTEHGVDIRQLMEIKTTMPDVLAYLWMAIDARLSVLISGSEFSGKRQLLFALSPFIPEHEKTLVFGNATKESKEYANFYNYVQSSGPDKRDPGINAHLKSALEVGADRVILTKLMDNEGKHLFACACMGIPFITTVEHQSNQSDIISKLMAKPFSIPSNVVNMLDLCVLMKNGNDSIWKIDGIAEYRWLSRTEIWLDEAEKLKDFEFKVTNIVENGVLNRDALKGSKVLYEYCNAYFASPKEAMDEFEERRKYLDEMRESKAGALEYINRYYREKEGQRNQRTWNL